MPEGGGGGGAGGGESVGRELGGGEDTGGAGGGWVGLSTLTRLWPGAPYCPSLYLHAKEWKSDMRSSSIKQHHSYLRKSRTNI